MIVIFCDDDDDDSYRTGTILNGCTFFLAFGFTNLAMIIIMIVKIISMNMIVMMTMIKVTMMVLTIMIIMTLVIKKPLRWLCRTFVRLLLSTAVPSPGVKDTVSTVFELARL